jgi:hypothetical protein
VQGAWNPNPALLAPGRQRVDRIPDDHSAVDPRLPIPNRTVKRRSADDSAGNYRVKVGHRQGTLTPKGLALLGVRGLLLS